LSWRPITGPRSVAATSAPSRRSRASPPGSGRHLRALGNGPAVALSVFGHAQLGHEHDLRRDHVRGQPDAQQAAQLRRHSGVGLVHDHVRDQAPIGGGAALDADGGRAHAVARAQRRLDLGRLDAKAPDLHLVVRAPNEREQAVGAPPHQIPRPVENLAVVERTGHEAGARGPGVVDVTVSQAVTAGVQLADNAHGDRLEVPVQHVHAGVGDGPSDRDAGVGTVDHVGRRESGVLRRPVAVDETAPGPLAQQESGVRRGDDVAAGQ
jgi:hypothetical protein